MPWSQLSETSIFINETKLCNLAPQVYSIQLEETKVLEWYHISAGLPPQALPPNLQELHKAEWETLWCRYEYNKHNVWSGYNPIPG